MTDLRGRKGKVAAGGIGGIIIALIAVFVFKQDPSKLGNMLGGDSGGGEQRELTPAEKEMGQFVEVVLGLTEDVWDEAYPTAARGFRNDGRFRVTTMEYEHPKLKLFSGQIRSACGFASSAVGPFYCPGDKQVYIDLSFYDELKQKFQAPGDFAQAYVIAHEVGHHVQKLLGISDYMHGQRLKLSKEEYNRLSVRLELQADYFAGVWARRVQEDFDILERGDIEEGLRAAAAIGDDTIQKRAQGHVVPESFTHGTSEQRVRWFTLGFRSGDPTAHNPFDPSLAYEDL